MGEDPQNNRLGARAEGFRLPASFDVPRARAARMMIP
jgi:hypothetical protein